MGLWLMALGFCATGILLLWQAVGAARDARAAHRWAVVAGRIDESRVERVGVGTTAGYEPYIAYTYEVAGRTYPGAHRGSRTPSETVAARALLNLDETITKE